MTFQAFDPITSISFNVPSAHHSIRPRRSQQLAVRADGQGQDLARVAKLAFFTFLNLGELPLPARLFRVDVPSEALWSVVRLLNLFGRSSGRCEGGS